MEFLSKSLVDTKKIASDFLAGLAKDSHSQAIVVGLYGNLGSGKTTFVQCVAEILAVSEHITSPTFVILKRFKIKDLKFKFESLIHIDAYRLKNSDELHALGFEKLLKDPDNFIFVEWADRVADILPKKQTKLFFEFVDENTRKITISP